MKRWTSILARGTHSSNIAGGTDQQAQPRHAKKYTTVQRRDISSLHGRILFGLRVSRSKSTSSSSWPASAAAALADGSWVPFGCPQICHLDQWSRWQICGQLLALPAGAQRCLCTAHGSAQALMLPGNTPFTLVNACCHTPRSRGLPVVRKMPKAWCIGSCVALASSFCNRPAAAVVYPEIRKKCHASGSTENEALQSLTKEPETTADSMRV